MTYLLDTDTFSNLVYDHARVQLRYSLVGTAATCISTVTVKEIEYRVERRRPIPTASSPSPFTLS